VAEESGKGGDAWLYSMAHGYSNLIFAVILMHGFRLQRPSDGETFRECQLCYACLARKKTGLSRN
jgi:hypothetical protein